MMIINFLRLYRAQPFFSIHRSSFIAGESFFAYFFHLLIPRKRLRPHYHVRKSWVTVKDSD